MKLIDVAAKHGEHYNVERTKQKINNLRCAFRHQLKKYNELKGRGEKEEPYCPKRKYFESLMFLKDEENRDKRSKQDNTGENISSCNANNGTKGETRLLSTETECGSADIGDAEKTASNNGSSVDDSLQVPNNIFSDICKEIQKGSDVNDTEEDNNAEEVSSVNISVISDKAVSLSQDMEDIAIAPIRREQVFIVDTSATTNASHISPSTQKHHSQQHHHSNNKSRKRSSSFSSQHSNETSETATPIKTTKSDITLDIENLLSLACKNFQKNSSDHHTSFGEIVAYKLRSMDAKQAIYAEKIISDILYQGQMKYLSPAAIERCSQTERLQQHENK